MAGNSPNEGSHLRQLAVEFPINIAVVESNSQVNKSTYIFCCDDLDHIYYFLCFIVFSLLHCIGFLTLGI